MNPDLTLLQPYPFEKLNALKAGITPPTILEHIPLSVGEPKHPAPPFVLETLQHSLKDLERYPATKGLPALREAIALWLTNRFNLTTNTLCSEHGVLPVNGTREALFAFTQTVIDRTATVDGINNPLVVSPNPFYQIYEGAALLAGAQPHFLPCDAENGFNPDYDKVSADTWSHCQLLFLCSPGNPTGSVTDSKTLKKLIALADKYDFIIASDECYSEIYTDEKKPPVGLLQACAELGRNDFKRCVVFHSLSKRSNLPGLRSGFVAGDTKILKKFLTYRTYHGSAMSIPNQKASIKAWQDEEHVKENRRQYKEKFSAVLAILGDVLDVEMTEASFYLWVKTPIADTDFAQQLFKQQHVTVLPGSFLSRTIEGKNPGENRVRLALVAPTEKCIEAAERIKIFVNSL